MQAEDDDEDCDLKGCCQPTAVSDLPPDAGNSEEDDYAVDQRLKRAMEKCNVHTNLLQVYLSMNESWQVCLYNPLIKWVIRGSYVISRLGWCCFA